MKFSFGCARPPSVLVGVLVLLAGLVSGCRREDIQVYNVPKPEIQTAAGGMAQGMPGAATETAPSLKYTTPAGWEQATAGEMRVASFRVKGEQGKQADVGVFPLPGMAGGDLNNVNRWRGQVGLEAVTEDQLAKTAEAVPVAGETAQLYDMAGENPSSSEKTRILAAILRREGTAWFFKMTGDDELVAKEKPNFISFLKSVAFAAPAQEALPPNHPPIGGAAATPVGTAVKPNWQVPAAWKELAAGQFLVAKFQVTGPDSSEATVNVSTSAGEGGGLLGNVNRWRGQLGLGALSEAEVAKQVTSVDTAGGKAMFVDMAGTDARTGQKTRLVGAIVPQGQQTWFYKLMGNEQLVEKEKAAFTQFVNSAKY